MSTAALRDLAVELADAADALTLAGFRGALATRRKADGTLVTAVDEAVEALLRGRIRDEFPGHRVVGEEGGSDAGDPEAPTWVIDPIDGTTNFVRGNPIFATLIGVVVDGADAVGVVSAPALGSRWVGVVGEGAEQDGRRVHVSDRADLTTAEVAFGDPSALESERPGLMTALTLRTGRQRAYGDFWNYGLLAAGSTDVVVEGRLNHWDLCACRALVLSAGGRVTDLRGQDRSDGGSAVASNGHLHGPVLAIAEQHRPRTEG